MGQGETSHDIRKRVIQARYIQKERFQGHVKSKNNPHEFVNALLAGEMLNELATPSTEAQTLLHQAAEKFKLSARSYYRLMKVARTIADLEASVTVERPHMAEALSYRQ